MKLLHIIPFITSMTILNMVACAFRMEFPIRYGLMIFSDIIILALLLSFVKARVRRWLEYLCIAIFLVLESIEAFISYNFNLKYEYNSLLLLFETNTKEATGFVTEYVLSWHNIIFFLSFFLAIVAIVCIYHFRDYLYNVAEKCKGAQNIVGIFVLGIIIGSAFVQINNYDLREHVAKTLLSDSDEHFDRYWIGLYNSPVRLAIAIKQVKKSTHDIEKCYDVTSAATVDSASNISPIIILYIGESYAKRHSQLYGYKLPTTPNAVREQTDGNLYAFTDVITPFNITSTTFKNLFSTHSVDEPGNWCDEPLFPRLFKLAGYKTYFISNQYIGRPLGSEECVIGDFFLDNESIRSQIFDYANTEKYKYDEQLFPLFDKALGDSSTNALVMFHVIGLHTPFSERYPANRSRFTQKDYQCRTELSNGEKQTVADYDNAVCYQDSINGALFNRLRNKDAIVIFVSDHGEEVFDFNHLAGRHHNRYEKDVVKTEYEVPMWIWCSPIYKEKHPSIVDAISNSNNKPFINTDIPHLLLDLACINSKSFDPTRSVINKKYDSSRQRMVGFKDHIYEMIVR